MVKNTIKSTVLVWWFVRRFIMFVKLIYSCIMEKKRFTITINATPERVWFLLWDDATYPEWTSPFSPGSRAVSDWKKGSEILFMGSDSEGMLSVIADRVDNQFMSFKHLGMVIDGQKNIDDEKYKAWAGAMENYTLQDADGKTLLTIDIDITTEHLDYFQSTWPQALAKLMEMAEQ